jgi:chromosome segregation ATPase
LSTLTKILIVLLTLSSIFLCGITVTYVGTANNYKQLWKDRGRENQTLKEDKIALEQEVNNLNEQLNKDKANYESYKDKLEDEIDAMGIELNICHQDLNNANERIKNAMDKMDFYAKTVEENNKLRKAAENKLANLGKLKIDHENKINQLNIKVVELSATIDGLKIEKKQLTEQKTKIQDDLNRTLQVLNQKSITPDSVTMAPSLAKIAPATRDINLEGAIMEVKAKDSLASIDKGSALGVRSKMRFHVIRNNKFICDVVISKVDADQAFGYLDLVTDTVPRAGDIVKTNF